MPVRTVADWGGLHEWALTAVEDLHGAGHQVTVVAAGERFVQAVAEAGAEIEHVEWDAWQDSAERLSARGSWDRVFPHGPLARNLGIEVGDRTGAPVHHMIHGAYLDAADSWSPRVARLLVASPSLQDFAVRVGKVEPWKIAVVPNGAPQEVFDLPLVPAAEKLAAGRLVIATAARLAPDKLRQIEPTIRLARLTAALHPEHQVHVQVMGDGPSRALFQRAFSEGFADRLNITVEFMGWVHHSEVPHVLNRSYAACVAGMGATRAIAAGCLTLAAGAQGELGLQTGQNLVAGLWSNFGDHGCPRFTPTDLATDLAAVAEPDSYDQAVRRARDTCHLHRNEAWVRRAMFDSLDLEQEK